MEKKPLIDPDSLLAVEVGSVNTRATLIDTVDNKYRFLASGIAPSTVAAPMLDAGEGVRHALDHLSRISGRQFIGDEEALIIPSTPSGAGIDHFVATVSAGEPLKVLAIGLLEEVSLASVHRLVALINAKVVDTLSLNDRRRPEAQIDSILRLRPDIVVIAGGTNDGATKSVMKLINTLGLALNMLPENFRPEILYAGNKNLSKNVTSFLGELAPLSVVANLHPELDVEDLGPAETRLMEIYRKVNGQKILGLQELESWSKGNLLPSPMGFGRIIRFLSRVYDPDKGVLGIEVGASSTTVAASFSGNLLLDSYPDLGIGSGLIGLLEHTKIEDIIRWIPYEVSGQQVINYIYNKSHYQSSLPATTQDLAIEQALARAVIRAGLRASKRRFPQDSSGPSKNGMLPWFEPIMIGGRIFADAPDMVQSLLMILDGVEPTGITRVILDKNSLASPLGVAAGVNSLMAVQVLESNAFLNLGTIISPIGKAHPGTPVLRLTIQYSSGQENTIDVKFGSLQSIPLPVGQSAQIHLQPLHRFDVGMGGPGKSGRLRVIGGYFGIVVDARGRPIQLPTSPERRRESLIRWYRSLKG